ncbi:MAG: ATP-binding cassette domain-containing protein [Deltaproteobacteria bacterium]|nr:ATP-binding cassette domain-containing protein [Deltaproteobacteria bacterium]
MSSEVTIAIEALTVRYGRSTAVSEVSLVVPEGSVCALLGRNGAGKSSLIRCLLGHRRPDAGRVTLFGEEVWRRRAALMARVGVVPESPDAPPELTVDQIARVVSPIHAR